MIDLIRDMFATPEAQADAYSWAAVLLAHAAIGGMLCGALIALSGKGSWRIAVAISALYGIAWEGGQYLAAGGRIADGLLDWTAVSLGALCAVALWRRQRRIIGASVAAVLAIVAAGTGKRR